jgi:molecular chaperone DnaK
MAQRPDESERSEMLTTHAVGIDLGTTYSCIAYLNEQGEPVSIPNQEGEISTPSVVMYDQGEVVVGTEALRNAIMSPAQVVQNAKRFIGDSKKRWTIDGKAYSPVDVSTAILRKLLRDAVQQIGPIDRAVITVPALFSEAQRLATVEAGQRAGLTRVDIINEPVAAALCYVLGTEGLWFTELTSEQRILVYDLGGGTFDLSLVSYTKDQVRVIASTGDLNLGGIDWNQCLLDAIASQFAKEIGDDPRRDPESLQQLSLEVEQCKRSLTVRPKAALIVQHAGHRKTYQVEREKFNALTRPLVRRTEEITKKLIDANKRGASRFDLTVLSTGGSSRMPMIDTMLAGLKGTTVNKALSPDQSIAHGATYYAGMLLTNSEFVHSIVDPQAVARLSQMRQQSVSARDLGILVRDMKLNRRVPHYLMPANTPLPSSVTKTFGTVIPDQKRVRLFIIESGAGSSGEYAELGSCTIEGLPPNLPADSRIDVTISYDASACVQVSARERKSGKEAQAEIRRGEAPPAADDADEEVVTLEPVEDPELAPMSLVDVAAANSKQRPVPPAPAKPAGGAAPRPVQAKPAAPKPTVPKPAASKPSARPPKPTIKPVPRVAPIPPPGPIGEPPRGGKSPPPKKRPGSPPILPNQGEIEPDPGAEEFWKMAGE